MIGDYDEALTDTSTFAGVVEQYAGRGMRCLGLAHRDFPNGVDFDETTSNTKNSDGTDQDAFSVETDMIFCALIGIEYPLRPEVPDAIDKFYGTGIGVRLVTGDSPNTAVSIKFSREFYQTSISVRAVPR